MVGGVRKAVKARDVRREEVRGKKCEVRGTKYEVRGCVFFCLTEEAKI
jgi:hypothetical protein